MLLNLRVSFVLICKFIAKKIYVTHVPPHIVWIFNEISNIKAYIKEVAKIICNKFNHKLSNKILFTVAFFLEAVL